MTQRRPLALARQPRSDAMRWAASIGGAVLLHGVAVAAMLVEFDAAPAETVEPPLAAMTVELAPLPSAPQQQVNQMPPGPEQVEQKVQPKPRPQPRQFDPPPQVSSPPPDALAAKPEEPEPEAKQLAAAERTTAAPSSQAQAQEALQAPVQGAPSDQGASAIRTWESQLLTHLEGHKRYPSAAQKRRQEGVVYLRFIMDRSGKVLEWDIRRSGGYAMLDDEVNALIQRASPLPPPPDEMGGTTIEMVVPVEFFLRRQLARGGS